jgi:hypothetical protein
MKSQMRFEASAYKSLCLHRDSEASLPSPQQIHARKRKTPPVLTLGCLAYSEWLHFERDVLKFALQG